MVSNRFIAFEKVSFNFGIMKIFATPFFREAEIALSVNFSIMKMDTLSHIT